MVPGLGDLEYPAKPSSRPRQITGRAGAVLFQIDHLQRRRKKGISVNTSAIFYSLSVVLLTLAFINAENLGLHPITVTYIITAFITIYLGWRAEDA